MRCSEAILWSLRNVVSKNWEPSSCNIVTVLTRLLSLHWPQEEWQQTWLGDQSQSHLGCHIFNFSPEHCDEWGEVTVLISVWRWFYLWRPSVSFHVIIQSGLGHRTRIYIFGCNSTVRLQTFFELPLHELLKSDISFWFRTNICKCNRFELCETINTEIMILQIYAQLWVGLQSVRTWSAAAPSHCS